MKFVGTLPKQSRARGSRYDKLIDIDALRHHPGEWALIAEDVPRTWQPSFQRWGTRRFLDTAIRTTRPGGNEIDLYVRAPKKEAQP